MKEELMVSYPIVRQEEYPHGIRCPDCKRELKDGEPYAERFEGVWRKFPIAEQCCVYCGGEGEG